MLRLGEVALRRVASGALLLGVATLPVVAACTTNHDALARRPSSGGAGGAGGSAGLPTGGFGNTGNQAQGGRMNPDDEPPGDDVLTVVNGVVDASSVRLCFARLDDEGNGELVGAPLPELPYGGSVVLTELQELSLAEDSLQPWVIAGDLSLVEDLDCAEAVSAAFAAEAAVTPPPEESGDGGAGAATGGAGGAGGDGPGGTDGPEAQGGAAPELEKPALRARSLAALPAGTAAVGRSILMVLSGCLGGAAYSGGAVGSVCGADYTPTAPTVQPVVVKLSRALRFDTVGLQGVHAALAMGSADLLVTGERGLTSLVFASSLDFGALAPRPADTRFTTEQLGVNSAEFGLQAVGEGAAVLSEAAWPELLDASGLPPLQAGRTYTAVLLGPAPRLLGGWWNRPTFALIDNDPTRQ